MGSETTAAAAGAVGVVRRDNRTVDNLYNDRRAAQHGAKGRNFQILWRKTLTYIGPRPDKQLRLPRSGDMGGYQMIEELAQRSNDTFALKAGRCIPFCMRWRRTAALPEL